MMDSYRDINCSSLAEQGHIECHKTSDHQFWNISDPFQALINSSEDRNESGNPTDGSRSPTHYLLQSYDWDHFKNELTWAFSVHVYAFACLFFMLSFYTFFSILNLRSQLSTRPFMSTINVFVCLLGVSRATCFLVDPYYSQRVLPGFLGWMLWDMGYPCIMSAFGLIQLAFSQLTQMTFRPESLRKKSFLSVVIAIHFLCVLASNVIAALDHKLQVIRIVIQVIFVSWGIVLCLTFLYGGGKILRLIKTLPSSAFQHSESVTEHKGILQLALLAQCNNIASSVITAAAAPSITTPKIKVTNDNNVAQSTKDEGNKMKVPEINITSAESPSQSETSPSPKEKSFTNQPIVKIEVCEATPESPIEDKFAKEIDTHKENTSLIADEAPPSKGSSRRKKSLSWVDESSNLYSNSNSLGTVAPGTSKSCSGATLGYEISVQERRRRRGSSEVSSRRSSNASICSSRRGSTTNESISRKGSYCSVASLKQGGMHPDTAGRKGSHVGEALVLSRRSSICSEASSRRGSVQALTPGSSSRRGSHRSIKDDLEGESLLKRPSDASDVTLSSILNHIAYVNQTNASNLGVKFKESRKEQVRQVLVVTYMTAILGMALSLLLVIGFYSHPPPVALVPSWVWFSYESVCRLLEFLIGCAMANITRQPVNRPSQYGHNYRMKARNSIYI